jgi:SAM-dependent methyltransferase
VSQIIGGFYKPAKEWIAPPANLMLRVAHSKDPDYFYTTGMKTCIELKYYLNRKIDTKNICSILDWGCGCGRLTPHLLYLFPDVNLYGFDIDKDSIMWSAKQYSEAKFGLCDLDPPLDLDSYSVDLTIAGSVFTHLSEKMQEKWLAEMYRILKDGGILIATIHGDFATQYSFQENYKEILKFGIYDSIKDPTLDSVVPSGYYRATYQSKEYTIKKWGEIFEIIDYIEAGYANFQDTIILRKSL